MQTYERRGRGGDSRDITEWTNLHSRNEEETTDGKHTHTKTYIVTDPLPRGHAKYNAFCPSTLLWVSSLFLRRRKKRRKR